MQMDRGHVLLVSDIKQSAALRVLRRAGFEVVTTYTVDHAVAVCASRGFGAVVLDQDIFLEVDGWSVAQSIKLVRSDQRVILITHASPYSLTTAIPPKGVDALVASDELRNLPAVVDPESGSISSL